MLATRAPRRRRGRRHLVRVAALSRAERIADEEAEAWRVALNGAWLLRAHFPDWYAVHAAGRTATVVNGLGVCCAFWQLVENRHGLALRWPTDDDYAYGSTLRDTMELTTPEEWLVCFDGVSEEWLSALWYWLDQPRPVYHGLGVQGRLSGDLPPPSDLTILIWHLLAATDLSVGDGVVAQLYHNTQIDDLLDVMRIRRIDAGVGARELLSAVAATIPEAAGLPDPAALLRYPLGQTGNPLADTATEELDLVHMGDDIEFWHWDRAAGLGRQQQEAEQIAEAYTAWRDRVEAKGQPGLRAVAAAFHRCARQLRAAQRRRDTTLIHLFALDTEPDEVDLQTEALV